MYYYYYYGLPQAMPSNYFLVASMNKNILLIQRTLGSYKCQPTN
jgi:hypothetical protein